MKPIIYSSGGKPIVFADDLGGQWEDIAEIDRVQVADVRPLMVVPKSPPVVIQVKVELTLLSAPSQPAPNDPEQKEESPAEAAMRRLGGFNDEIEEERRRVARSFLNGLIRRPVG